MNKIKNHIWNPIKKRLINLSYLPEKIMLQLYYDAADHKYPFPDKLFQKWDYWIFNKKRLSFKNPQTYNEKLQWLKYYYRNPAYIPLVDKYEVRKFVEEKVGSEILIPCLGIYEKWDDIDFSKLPNSFVIKCTHDSGSVVICKDKNNFDFDSARKKIERGLSQNQFYKSREWCYKNVKPRIIIEEFLENDDGTSIIDYKFMCFDGVSKVVDILRGKNRNETVEETYFDIDLCPYKVTQGHPNISVEIKKTSIYEKMVEYATILSENIPHVRVDFILVNDKIYFTELTFFNSGGRCPFNPESFDYFLGGCLNLPPKMR